MAIEHSKSKPTLAETQPEIHGVPDSVNCASCGAEIQLTQMIVGKFEGRVRARLEGEARQRETELRAEAARAVAAAVERTQSQVKEKLATRMADLAAQVQEKSHLIDAAKDVELELRRNQRALEEREKNLTLEVARRVDTERKEAEQQATERAEEEFRLREASMKEQLASMTRTIEDLKRKAEQGSQQTQGEAAEVELETVLRQGFPMDEFTPVSKGVRGADIVHTVRAANGNACASIVWEMKTARTWSSKWLEKIRDDQREASAELAVVVTTAMPPGLRHFGQIDGIWVADLNGAPVLAAALRAQLVAVNRERVAAEGRSTKEAQLYDYVTGTEFRNRVVGAVAPLVNMKSDLGKERASAMRAFAKRDKQIVAAADQIAGLYGSAQGIVGGSLKPVALLESTSEDDDEATDLPDGLFEADAA